MELTEKQVAVITESLLAIQELVSDVYDIINPPDQEAMPKEAKEEPIQEVAQEPTQEEARDEEMALEEVIKKFEIAEMSEEDLRDTLEAYEIKFTKKEKKESLVNKVAQGILDGTIEVEEEANEEEPVEDPLASKDVELSPREEAEQKILAEIEKAIEDKTLTAKTASAWLKKHFANGECKECPKRCKDDPVECYKRVKTSFVDDEGEIHPNEEAYIREEVVFCCGVECEDDGEGKAVCTVCGQVWETEEE